MTTYNSYEEAKIANPEGGIFTKAGKFIGECDLGPSPHTYEYRGIAKCNPADHCMTVERFLADGHRFVEGDLYIDWKGCVRGVGMIGHSVDACNDVRYIEDSLGSYILRAAVLEERVKMDNSVKYVARNQFDEILKMSPISQEPRTKVEYVEVTDSIFDLRPDFEAGELFSKVNHARDYSTINNTQTLAQALHQSCCYRRIETPITEREAFIEAAIHELKSGMSDIDYAKALFDSGKFKLVN